jgi:hypothetical protein
MTTMLPSRPADRRGMTLMETLVVIGIMTMIMVVISRILVVNDELFSYSLARMDADRGATLAMRRFSELARGASAVVASHDIAGTTYASDDDSLVLQLPSVDASGNLIASSYDYVAFYRHATETDEIWTATDAADGSVRADGAKLLTAYNDVLIFRYDDPDRTDASRVSAYLENSNVSRGRTISSDAWTSIFLRNKE